MIKLTFTEITFSLYHDFKLLFFKQEELCFLYKYKVWVSEELKYLFSCNSFHKFAIQ